MLFNISFFAFRHGAQDERNKNSPKSISGCEKRNESRASVSDDEEKTQDNKSLLSDCNATERKQSSYNFKLDPCVFAPTGDIYSYFNRRPMLSASAGTFKYPFRYSTIQALS